MQPDAKMGYGIIGTRTAQTQRAKIAVDDAVLLHKFSSEISVDKFLAEIPFPRSVCLSCLSLGGMWGPGSVSDDDQCSIVGWQRHANFPASFPFRGGAHFGAF